MARLNVVGASFTICILSVGLIFAVWRLMVAHDRILRCYQDQLKDAVTLLQKSGD